MPSSFQIYSNDSAKGKPPRCPNRCHRTSQSRRSNGFLGLSLNDGIILFLVILLDKTVSVGPDKTVFALRRLPTDDRGGDGRGRGPVAFCP